VWALGVILYRCLTGKLPFEGDSMLDTLERIKTMQMRPLRELCAEVPADLEAICLACLRKAPGERPTAAELAGRLEATYQPEASARETSDRVRAAGMGGGRTRWLLAGGAALLLLGMVLWAMQGKGKTDPATSERGASPVEPPLKVLLRVEHFERQRDRDVPHGPIGGKSMEALVDDRVVVKAELSSPGYCYVIGFNFDGKEQLLWPRNEKSPDRTIAPPLLERVQCRPLALDDDVRGGMQAYVVVASMQPLPGYEEWKRGRPGECPWRYLPASPGVWRSDGEVLDTVQAGDVLVRAREVDLEGQPPMLPLSRWARGAGVTVEAVAFPVYRREKP
jgi:hypothetical protein